MIVGLSDTFFPIFESVPLTVTTAAMSGKAALFCGAIFVVAFTFASAEIDHDYSFLAELVRNVSLFETTEDDAAEGIYVQLKNLENADISA